MYARHAHYYVNGEGIEQNESLAVAWYKKAADQGNAAAKALLK